MGTPPDMTCVEGWFGMGNATWATDDTTEETAGGEDSKVDKKEKGKKDRLYDAMIPMVGAAASSSWIPGLASAAAGVAAAIAMTAALIVLWRQSPASDASERLNENIYDAEPGSSAE